MKIQIKSIYGSLLFEGDFLSLAEAIRAATTQKVSLLGSDLRGSNLRGSNLLGSNLRGSNLRGSDLRLSDLRGSTLSGSNLSDSDLSFSDLSFSNLRGSDLRGSNLRGSNLRGSNLSGSNLRGSNLRGSNLRGSNLSGSNLSDSDLSFSDLRGSDLRFSDLRFSDLRGSDLRGSDLRDAKNAELAQAMTVIVPQGDLIGWKKCKGETIVKLRIPADAKRINATGRKCRAEFADVMEISGGLTSCMSNRGVVYEVGKRVVPDSWDENRWEECSHGIHFFITREEAEAYIL
jgi:uncharacterized protein YjbI with pentapeptide repeats